MGLSVIKRYLKIYALYFRFGLLGTMAYPASFLVQIAVESGYSLVFILFIKVIFSRISQIAGWTYYEVLFLSGMSIITSELLLGALYVFNLWELPKKIKNGDIDPVLLRPVNSLFSLSLGQPYFSGFLSGLPGAYLCMYSATNLGIGFSPMNILGALVVFICGLLIGYAISVILASAAFYFPNAESVPRIANEILFNWTDKPHHIYAGFWRNIFFVILPVVYLNSVPTAIFIRGLDYRLLLLSLVLAVVFMVAALKIWNHMIRFYSSASS